MHNKANSADLLSSEADLQRYCDTRSHVLTVEQQQDGVDSTRVWCHLFPNRGCVAGNGRVPSTR
jgi:hypothetical protein